MADDGCQHGQGNVVDLAHPDPRHHQIEKHVYPGPQFGHACQILRGMRRGGGPDADHRAGQARCPQDICRPDNGAAFLLGKGGVGLRSADAIAFTRMRHHPGQTASRMQGPPQHHQQRIIRPQPAAMTVAVDLDQRRNGRAKGTQRLGLARTVKKNGQIASLCPQRLHAWQFPRGDAHGIKDVAIAGGVQRLGLGQGRDRCGPHRATQQTPRDGFGFRGLDMRAQLHPKRCGPCGQTVDIAGHARLVKQQRRRVDKIERIRRHGKPHCVIPRPPLITGQPRQGQLARPSRTAACGS